MFLRAFLSHIKKLDWVLIVSILFLFGIGLLSIYSSSLGRGNFTNFQKQIFFGLIGFFLMITLSFFNWRLLRDNPYFILIIYFFVLISLAGLLFFAKEIRGVQKWYQLGIFSIDPAEFLKIILIILFAKYFSTKHIEMYRVKHLFLSGFYVLVPSFLLFLQPDLGSVIVLLGLWVGILLISGIKLRHFLILILTFVLISAFSWSFLLRDYQKARVISFLQPTDVLGSAWTQNQTKIAIGSGGILGKGFGRGSQTQLGFLPEPQTDFIFSAIAEEFGLVGVFVLLSLFLILLWRIIKIALNSTNNFPRLFAAGFAILLLFNIFINIGMNVGMLPIIGIPLPLVSYGGSGLISIFLGLGILQSFRTS
jgi:rod shape determining protein RodA